MPSFRMSLMSPTLSIFKGMLAKPDHRGELRTVKE